MATMTDAYQVHQNDKSKDHNSSELLRNLVLTKVPKPSPGPGEVLVRIRAAALNYRDLMVVASSPLYPVITVPGLVPGADGAGEIEAVGTGSKWANSIGEGVLLVTNSGWLAGDDASQYIVTQTLGAGDVDGTLRQYAVVKDELLVKKPKNLSYEEAAAAPAAAGTALHALEVVKIVAGTTILTQGTGGVSSYTIQLASALGARVIATSSSDEKLQVAKGLGASELINYRTTPNWSAEVLKLTDGKGVDLVVDVGGVGTINHSMLSVKVGGTISMVGYLASENSPEVHDVIQMLIYGAKTLKGIRGQSKAHLERAVEVIEKHNLHPEIGTPYEWSNASMAFEALRDGNFTGKIVVKV
ncbi:putative alcohol dehydrogenase [Stipitochalara longipes BDJ]|nr:putative alcohol dehydrogenase [Stipitochalara longipes BDJ]